MYSQIQLKRYKHLIKIILNFNSFKFVNTCGLEQQWAQFSNFYIINTMESLVSRWKNAITAVEENTDGLDQSIKSYKKSAEKSRKKFHQSANKQIKESRTSQTPYKNQSKNTKQQILEQAFVSICSIFTEKITDKQKSKIKHSLQQLWISAQNFIKQDLGNISSSKQSKAPLNSVGRAHQLLYHDLQKKYFECQKQKQFLKSKLDGLLKKYEGIDRQLDRYGKMEKLIDSIMQREKDMRQQNFRLKEEIEKAQIKDLQQQKIFRSEVDTIRELVNSIRSSLPNQ